jgi:O-antigen ligase
VLLAGLVFVVRSSFLSITGLRSAGKALWGIGVAAALLGLVQHARIWPDGSLLLRVHSTGRIFSTMGNPNLLASFLAAALLASLGLLVSGREKLGKSLIVAGMLVMAVAFALTGSRGSVAGLIVGSAFFLLLTLWWRLGRRKTRSRAAMICVLVFATVSLSVLVMAGRGAPDIGSVVDPNRRFVWQGATRMFLAAPLTGYGVGRFGIVFPTFHYGQHENPDFGYVVSHAHCEPLEIACELGVTGLILALCMAGAFVTAILRTAGPVTLKSSRRLALGAGFIAAVVAILGQSLVSVNTRWVQISCPAAVMVGLTLAAVRPYACSRRVFGYSLVRGQERALRLVLLAFAVALVCVLTPLAIAVVRADIELRRGTVLVRASEHAGPKSEMLRRQALRRFESSVRLNPYRAEAWYILGGTRQVQGDHEGAVAAYDEVCRLVPDYARVHLLRGQSLLCCGRKKEAAQDFERDMNLYRNSALGRGMLAASRRRETAEDGSLEELD